ncbi:hypothetical protein [Spongiactinospora sp. TRM90649]|uniref:hypothetical protein n=1 Tax=Spongiactinospora sp. TRM90649 TaxID=3031114 RepID=UPI0023F72ECA|nr:hypothetical protein [Spongiactinospora sp. TRM90649]MDF5753154.1 hypothetical protein [Spongiactinospora sp. TRM90649]
MSQGRGTVDMYFAAIGTVLLLGLGYFAPWPFWASVLLVSALVAGAILVTRRAGRRPRPESTPAYSSFPPAPRPEQRRKQVEEIPLPSSTKDYNFLFSATVLWTPSEDTSHNVPLNLEGVAVQAVIERAREVTERWSPEQVSLAQCELGGTLGRAPEGHREVHVVAQGVVLTLADDDRKRLEMLAIQRKEMAVWQQNKEAEQSRRRYLSEDVLKSPGAAVVWHLDRNGEQVEATVNDIVRLTRLSLAAHDRLPEDHGADPARPPYHATPADHADAMLFTAGVEDTDQQAFFAAELADLFTRYGSQEAADDLRRRFDQPRSHPASEGTFRTPEESNLNGTGHDDGSVNGSAAALNVGAGPESEDGEPRPE